jgi:2-oxoisovalerate dehydrogenase E2 component (dihydrolipoyl transacylase)
MLREFKLPDVGEGLLEAEIVKWHVATGDSVKVNQTIVEIETAKAVVELPCPFEGTVTALMADEGQTVDVGSPIIAVETGEPAAEDAPRVDDLVPRPPAEGAVEPGVHGGPAPKQERKPVLVGYGVMASSTKRRPRKAAEGSAAPAAPAPAAPAQATAPAPAAPAPAAPAQATAPAPAARIAGVLAKPPVRKLARDLGVNLATLTGTGPQGSITREDVQSAVAAPVPVARPAAPGREERVPVKGVRKATAQAMVASAFSAPHVTEFLQVDVTETMEAVRRLRQLPDFADVKVSPLLLVAKALLTAVRRYPMANSTWTDDEIIVKHYVNLGIAAATDRGLIVPNIKDAQTLSLPELARALAGLTERARAGKATPSELTGGTITITNVGVFGVDAGTPILNPGEAAILAVGQIRDMPWVVDGQLVVRKVTTLALSFDHRLIDGELGSYVLRDVGAMLEDPLRMLAWG